MGIPGLGVGIYSISEASRLTRINPSAIRRWLWGTRRQGRSEAPPLWDPQHPREHRALGFRDLIELRFVDALRRRGVSLQTIRRSLAKAVELWHHAYPLSSLDFKTDGNRIFADVATSDERRLLLLLPSGQLNFDFVLDSLYSALEYDDRTPVLWRPNKNVIIDPARNFGQPIVPEGVPTSVLYAGYVAENSVDAVARWYDVPAELVEDAVNFEASLAA